MNLSRPATPLWTSLSDITSPSLVPVECENFDGLVTTVTNDLNVGQQQPKEINAIATGIARTIPSPTIPPPTISLSHQPSPCTSFHELDAWTLQSAAAALRTSRKQRQRAEESRRRGAESAHRSRLRRAARMAGLERRARELQANNRTLHLRLAVLESQRDAVARKEREDQEHVYRLERQLAELQRALQASS
ncbi:hypothetical protein BCR43DRAFT_483207, partial [Syncephalastrum racemosum]